ncbi:MAG: hypothetical protein JW795_16940 [Chitinivibrionales bacterium]|nr:hypothetical protein [Chitinivibrionales bacterium]
MGRKGIMLCCSVLLAASTLFSDVEFKYRGFGLGGSISTCIVGDGIGIGFGTGFHGTIEFSLGPGNGHLQFYPSILFIFTGEDYSQLSLNYTDVKYLFPISNPTIRPYAGLGIGININMWPDANDPTVALNQFAGLDFKVSPKVHPFIEVRFSITDPITFRFLTGGMTFKF